MDIITSFRSPNFSDQVISVEFVVLHFTAGSLQRTFEIFADRSSEVSAHLVVDRDGSVYEVVECFSGTPRRAWHAGKSRFEVSKASDCIVVESFNDRSVGIELVNLNGNLFAYTDAQYESLERILESLKVIYPALQQAEAIVGHEQIAGFRGKSDPGRCFDWNRLYRACYPKEPMPHRGFRCPQPLAEQMMALVKGLGVSFDIQTGVVSVPSHLPPALFSLLSSMSEAALRQE